ncbi:MAG: hypothetical protein U0939_07780 [Pirellulales bacterium]
MPAPRSKPSSADVRKPKRRRWRLAFCLLGLLAVAAAAAIMALWAAQRTPEFYRRALARDADRPAGQGDELERRTLELRNSARRPGEWTYVIDEEELNGWLAKNLLQEFPQALPKPLEAPRVAISEDGVRVGCQYREGRFTAVASLELDVYLADDSRSVAVELKSLRAGLLPLPMDRVLKPLQEAARKQDLAVRWSQSGSVPVALWSIPERSTELGGRRITLQRIELRNGQVRVSGRSE